MGAGLSAAGTRLARIGEAALVGRGSSRAFGFGVIEGGEGLKVGVWFTENAYTFNTPVDKIAVGKLLRQIEARNPGTGLYVGSGGHGGEFGKYFAHIFQWWRRTCSKGTF